MSHVPEINPAKKIVFSADGLPGSVPCFAVIVVDMI